MLSNLTPFEDWFPNHCLVLHVLLLFSVLNPFVLPFGTLYFFVQTGVMKNQVHLSRLLFFLLMTNAPPFQFIHVYSKNFEGDGKILLIRIVRYSLDGQLSLVNIFTHRSHISSGLVLSQAIFLAYMVVLRKSVNAGLAAFLIVFTVLVKVM
jgi:hypothetical protein